MLTKKPNSNTHFFFLLFIVFFMCYLCSSQKTCPNCGSTQVPYPLSTNPNCGDLSYRLTCDSHSQRLYFDALNGSSYLVLKITPSVQRIVIQPSPWVPGDCVTQDMSVSEGIRLNQTLPFNITPSNTIFVLNCSPRLLVSPLNCSRASVCHRYLENSGNVDSKRAGQCAGEVGPCCTFVAGGMPSSYRIRLHSSGCKAFRSIVGLDLEKPASQWEEGLEIQWAPPPEPPCTAQRDCAGPSKCIHSQCVCNTGYRWDSVLGTCLRKKGNTKIVLAVKLSIGVFSILCFGIVTVTCAARKSPNWSSKARRRKTREDMLKTSNGGKSARMFSLREMKKATNGFSADRVLGSGGFGEVYRGELPDGTTVAVKCAKVGNIKSTEQVLNEVGILSQVNHKNLVKLLGCCMEAHQPLMVYEFISNGTLHDHLHGKYPNPLTWAARLRIAKQTAEALAYLHSAAYTPIFHRDVKSTNILLDSKFNAKVADFGLSRLACPGLSHVTTCAQGTLGYLDPEYFRNYQLTDKSDVYSYGVVLLELLTSQKAVDFSRGQDDVNLAIFVRQRAENGGVLGIVDQRVFEGNEVTEEVIVRSVEMLSEVALCCLKEKKADRPCMKDVLQELDYIIQIMDQNKCF